MFYGSLTEDGDVPMTNSNVTAAAFKEFLRYIYTGKITLTMDNIDELIFLADLSLCEEFFDECQNFLKNQLTVDNIFTIYQLALRHERAKDLKAICEEEICLNAERIFTSPSFANIQFEFLQNSLVCDSLVCEEKVIFNACMTWAKAACRQQGRDQYNPINLRTQLQDSIYQIRFTSMTIGDAADCISSCPDGFFSAIELKEIMCMVGRKSYPGEMKFNWTPRYFSLHRDSGHQLTCNRYSDAGAEYFMFNQTETISFTCNRHVLLKGFTTECNQPTNIEVNITIEERKTNDHINVRYNGRKVLHFSRNIRRGIYTSFEATVELDNVIYLRPDNIYTINVTFEMVPIRLQHNGKLKNKVRVDHDIVLKFWGSKNIVTSLVFSRLNNPNHIIKIMENPKTWLILILLLLMNWLVRLPIWPVLFKSIILFIEEFKLNILLISIGLIIIFLNWQNYVHGIQR